MFKAKLTKKGKKLENIMKSIQKLDGQRTEIGYFQSQGRHRSGEYSYAGLAQALEIGYFPVQGIKRRPMPFMGSILKRTVSGIKSSGEVKAAFRMWSKNLVKRASPKTLLESVGKRAVLESKHVFNNPFYFPQAPSNSSPNYETGDLAEHFTYKTSFDGRVRRP